MRPDRLHQASIHAPVRQPCPTSRHRARETNMGRSVMSEEPEKAVPLYRLYWDRGSANMAPHAILREIGCPFELVRVDISKSENRAPSYLAINPNHRVPTLVHGDRVLYEISRDRPLSLRKPSGSRADAAAGSSRPPPVPSMAGLFHQHAAGRPAALVACRQLPRSRSQPPRHENRFGTKACRHLLAA